MDWNALTPPTDSQRQKHTLPTLTWVSLSVTFSFPLISIVPIRHWVFVLDLGYSFLLWIQPKVKRVRITTPTERPLRLQEVSYRKYVIVSLSLTFRFVCGPGFQLLELPSQSSSMTVTTRTTTGWIYYTQLSRCST